MARAGGGPAILPVTRGPLQGINTFHRYLVLQTQVLAFGTPIISDLRWHLGLDKIYFQLLCLNKGAAVAQIDWDIFLRLDNVEDTLPYNSGTQNFLTTVPGAPNYDTQSFPLGGLPMPSSSEYYVRLTLKADTGAPVEVSLWAVPELWYTFRYLTQADFT